MIPSLLSESTTNPITLPHPLRHPISNIPRFGITPLGRSREELEASAELQRLQQRKREEGVLMGRESSGLCCEKRRRGFLDGEDFWDIVDEE